MLARLTERELAMWLVYIGRVREEERHADARAAAIIAAIYESRRNPRRRGHPFTAKDFLPRYPDDAPPVPISPMPERPEPISTPNGSRRMSADDSARYAISVFEHARKR